MDDVVAAMSFYAYLDGLAIWIVAWLSECMGVKLWKLYFHYWTLFVPQSLLDRQTDRRPAGRSNGFLMKRWMDAWLHGMDGIKIIQIIIKVHWHLAGKWSAAVVLTHYHRYLSSNSKKQHLYTIHSPLTIHSMEKVFIFTTFQLIWQKLEKYI